MWTATNTEAAVELSAMWRLKTSEGGGQWMQTVSEFHGRQVWEFHSDAGTEEERAQVERLRREFTDNRFQRRESSDLLMRMQLTGLKHLHAEMPTAVKLEEGDEEKCKRMSMMD
ncbi:hypothetical protein QOZ80_6BG0492180 [Eleusine coracana subsp. coracana]|nr:hypothetical protein QOZ80_6BG0492180 [Eleusine coracana subsp. coracana]